MADEAFDATRWPEIPSGFDDELKRYLQEMQDAVDKRLSGTVSIPGDLTVGGYLVLMAPNRIKTYIE